jgi:raw score 3.67
MENFKKVLQKLFVIFLLIHVQEVFSMTQAEIRVGKAYLAEMIDIASEIMEKKQSIDPDSLQYKRRNIKVRTYTNMKNGYTSYTLEKSKIHLIVPKELKQETKLNLYWDESKGSINIRFDKDELKKYFHLNLKKSGVKSEKLETAFDETTFHFTFYEFSMDKYPNVTVEFRIYHSPNTTFRLDYPPRFTRILIYSKP